MANRKQVIGITGAKGLLGSELMKIEGAVELEGDITNPQNYANWPQVDYIINCAAQTNVDWCEVNKDKAWDINLGSVEKIIKWMKGLPRQPCLIQISSEMSIRPVNVYGFTKRMADDTIRSQIPDSSVILYTCHLFGNSTAPKKTFPNWVIEKLKEKKNFDVAADIYCRPTWTRDVRHAIEWIIQGGYRGDLVVAGADYVSKWEHARMIEDATIILMEPDHSAIGRRFGYQGPAPRESVDLWKEKIPRFINTTPLVEATEQFMREYTRDHP